MAAKKASKAPAKKTKTEKKTSSKKFTTAKLAAIKAAYTKTQLQSAIADATELSKKQISLVFDELSHIIERHMRDKAAGEFTLPGLLKVRLIHKPATKARKGVNPFTGEDTVFKAKPARNVVKIKPLKRLKAMVNGE